MLKKHYVTMTLFMLIENAIAAYGEHPKLLRSDGTIADTPLSSSHYCVSDSICTYTTQDKGWWQNEANIDCADKCSAYTDSAMTAVSGWIECGNTSDDNCAANKDTSQSCPVAFPSNINTAPTATQGSGTVSLDLGDLTTIASSCTLTLSIVDLTLAGTATTGIVTVDTTTKVVSYDTTDPGIVTFKLQGAGAMTYGTWSWGGNSQSSDTITVDPCKSATFTDTLTPASPSKMATFQVGDLTATFVVTFTSFTSSPSGCAPSTYRLSTDSTSGLTLNNVAKTVTVNNNKRSIVADYTFTVEALKSDGSYYNSGTSYIISVACTSSLTISAPSELSTTSQFGKIGDTEAQFVWNYDFTSEYSSCPILTQELTNAGSGTAALPTNYAYPTTDAAGQSSLTIPFTSFALNAWAPKWGNCAGIAKFGSGNRWKAKAFTGKYGCWSMAFYGNQNGAGNNKRCLCKPRYEAKLADVTSPGSYNFYLKVSANGTAIKYFGPYSYLLQCASLDNNGAMTKHASFLISAPASITATQYFLIGQSDIYFKFEPFTVSHAGCPIQSYKLTDASAKIVAASPTGINTASGTTISLDSGYLKVYPTDTASAQTLTFYVIVGTMGPVGSESNEYPENFGPYKIDIMVCGLEVMNPTGILSDASSVTYLNHYVMQTNKSGSVSNQNLEPLNVTEGYPYPRPYYSANSWGRSLTTTINEFNNLNTAEGIKYCYYIDCGVYTDAALTTPFVSTNQIVWNTTDNNRRIWIDTQYGEAYQKLWITATTYAPNTHTKAIEITICPHAKASTTSATNINMLDYRYNVTVFSKNTFIEFFNSTTNCPIDINPLKMPVGESDTTLNQTTLDKLMVWDPSAFTLTVNGSVVDTTFPSMVMIPVGGFVWGYANSQTTTLYLILDFQRLIKVLKTEEYNAARIVAVEEDIAEAQIAARNDPPSFFGYVIREFTAHVDIEAEDGSTVEIISAFGLDPDEVQVDMTFSGTNSISDFASIQVIGDTAFAKRFKVVITENKVTYEQLNQEYVFKVVLEDDFQKSEEYEFKIKLVRKEVLPELEEEEEVVIALPPPVVERKNVQTKGTIQEEPELEPEPAWVPEIDDSPAPTVKVSGISPQGEIKMTFDQDMFVPPNVNTTDFSSLLEVAIMSRLDGSLAIGNYINYTDWIMMKAEQKQKKNEQVLNSLKDNSTNSTRLLRGNPDDLELEEQVEDCSDIDDCDATNKVFEWTVQKFDKKEVVIQTNFQKPGQISTTSYGADNLEVSILEPKFFIAKRKRGHNNYYMEPNTLNVEQTSGKKNCPRKGTISCGIMPPLLLDEETAKIMEQTAAAAQTALTSVTILTIIVGFLVGAVMFQLLSLIRQLQLMVLQSVLNIVYPAQLVFFYQICVTFAGIDLLDGPSYYEIWFTFQETPALNDAFDLYDIGDMNFLNNTGSMFLGLLIFFALRAIWFVVNILCTKCYRFKYARKLGIYASDNISIRDTLLVMVVDGYIDVALSSILGFLAIYRVGSFEEFALHFSSLGDILNSVFSISLIIISFLLPFFTRWLIGKNFEHLSEDVVIDNWGIFYREYRDNDLEAASFNQWSLARRLLIVMLLVFFESQTWFQCIAIMWVSTFNLAYLMHVKPYRGTFENRFEIFNEFIIYLSSVIHLNFMFESSPLMTDDLLALKSKIGWVQIGVVSSNVFVNLTMVGKSTLGELKDQIIDFVNSFHDRKKEKLEAQAREKILGELEGNVVEYIKMKEEEHEALEFCKDYHPQRLWCRDNGLDFTQLDDEKLFLQYLEKFKFKAKREIIDAEIEVRRKIIQKYTKQVQIEQKAQRERLLKERTDGEYSQQMQQRELDELSSENLDQENEEQDLDVRVKAKRTNANVNNRSTEDDFVDIQSQSENAQVDGLIAPKGKKHKKKSKKSKSTVVNDYQSNDLDMIKPKKMKRLRTNEQLQNLLNRIKMKKRQVVIEQRSMKLNIIHESLQEDADETMDLEQLNDTQTLEPDGSRRSPVAWKGILGSQTHDVQISQLGDESEKSQVNSKLRQMKKLSKQKEDKRLRNDIDLTQRQISRQEEKLEYQKNCLVEQQNKQPEGSELREALQVEIDRQQAIIDSFRENKEEKYSLFNIVKGAKSEAEMEAAEIIRLQIRVEELTLEDATAGVFEEKYEFAEDLELIQDGTEENKEKEPMDEQEEEEEKLEEVPEVPTLLSSIVQCLIENKDFVEKFKGLQLDPQSNPICVMFQKICSEQVLTTSSELAAKLAQDYLPLGVLQQLFDAFYSEPSVMALTQEYLQEMQNTYHCSSCGTKHDFKFDQIAIEVTKSDVDGVDTQVLLMNQCKLRKVASFCEKCSIVDMSKLQTQFFKPPKMLVISLVDRVKQKYFADEIENLNALNDDIMNDESDLPIFSKEDFASLTPTEFQQVLNMPKTIFADPEDIQKSIQPLSYTKQEKAQKLDVEVDWMEPPQLDEKIDTGIITLCDLDNQPVTGESIMQYDLLRVVTLDPPQCYAKRGLRWYIMQNDKAIEEVQFDDIPTKASLLFYKLSKELFI